MTFDYAIVGGGLAGLTLAHTLVADRDVSPASIVLFDARSEHRGSDAPGAMLHPFPSRSLIPHPQAMEGCYTSIELLRHWAETFADDAIHSMPMVRPIFDDHVGERLRETWHDSKGSYPSWLDIQHVDGDALDAWDARLADVDDAIVYEPAVSVDLATVRDRLFARLADAGVDVRRDVPVEGIASDGDGWHLRAEATARAARVVLACSQQLGEWFPDLDVRGRGGELMIAEHRGEPPLQCAVNASGHVAPRADGSWVVGSTWWNPEDFDNRTDREAADALLERGARLIPALKSAEVESIWRGVRVKYRDHWPLVGPVPGRDGLHALTAFGSKGLFRIPFFAERLADLLVDRCDTIDDRAHSLRVDDDEWHADRLET